MDHLLPSRTQGSAQVLGWFSFSCRWVHHIQPPQQIFKTHFPVPSTAEETKLDIYFGKKALCFMSGISDVVFRGGNSYVFTSPFRFCFSEDHAVPLKKMKGEGMSQVIYFFLIPRIGLSHKKENTSPSPFFCGRAELQKQGKIESQFSLPSFTGRKKKPSTRA